MSAKLPSINVMEGSFNFVDRAINVDHIIQFEPNLTKAQTSNIYLSDGKVLCVACPFDSLIQLFKN